MGKLVFREKVFVQLEYKLKTWVYLILIIIVTLYVEYVNWQKDTKEETNIIKNNQIKNQEGKKKSKKKPMVKTSYIVLYVYLKKS